MGVQRYGVQVIVPELNNRQKIDIASQADASRSASTLRMACIDPSCDGSREAPSGHKIPLAEAFSPPRKRVEPTERHGAAGRDRQNTPAYGSTECCPAEFDGDEDVDAADLAELLSSWGPRE